MCAFKDHIRLLSQNYFLYKLRFDVEIKKTGIEDARFSYGSYKVSYLYPSTIYPIILYD